MTTLVLIRAPRTLAYAQIVRAICRHVGVPASSETYWAEGYGDINIDLRGTTTLEAEYVAELYLVTTGIEWRILDEGHNKGPTHRRVPGAHVVGHVQS